MPFNIAGVSMIISPPKHRHQHAQHEMLTIMAPMTASLTLRPLADAGGGGLFYSRFPPFFGDAALSLPHVLCCDARPHTRHPVARVRDYPTDIDGRVSSVRLKRLLALRGGVNPVALAGKCAKSAALFFTKPAIEDDLAKQTWVIEIKRLIRRGFAGLALVKLCSYCLLSKRLDHQSELLAPLSDEAQERRLEGCPFPVIVDVPDDLKKLIVEVRLPKNLRGLGEKAFYLESPEEELGRKIRLVVTVDGISKAWTLQLPLAKHLDPTIKSKLIWVTSIDGASQSKFRRCRLEVI
jgi:hypothetical protein